MSIFYSLYIVQLSDKYENSSKEMCFNAAYMILGQEYQYIVNWNNNATQISSVEIDVGILDMHTL